MHPHNAAFSRAPQARRLEGFVMLAALPQGKMVIDAPNLQTNLVRHRRPKFCLFYFFGFTLNQPLTGVANSGIAFTSNQFITKKIVFLFSGLSQHNGHEIHNLVNIGFKKENSLLLFSETNFHKKLIAPNPKPSARFFGSENF